MTFKEEPPLEASKNAIFSLNLKNIAEIYS